MSLRSLTRLSFAVPCTRTFTTTSIAQKSVIDQVKETAEAVNKKVGQTLASGIGAAEDATQSAKETVDAKTTTADELSTKAQGVKQQVNHNLGAAAGKARDVKEEVEKKI